MSRRILFISPAFHGYWKPIATSLSSRGHRVTPLLYDANPSLVDKLRRKLVHEPADLILAGSGTRALRRRVTKRAIQALNANAPDLVLVIKSDLVGLGFWEELSARRVESTLWLYDEIRRTQLDPGILDLADHLVTYSPHDAQTLRTRGLPGTYLPNAFDHHVDPRPLRSNDIVFIGARYPNRESVLRDLHAAGIPVRAFGRQWSHHPLDRIRTWDLQRPEIPAGRDVDRHLGYRILAGAAASLNVHFDQDGFTMRTFEAAGCGALQLIDRPEVSQFYEPDQEVLVYEDFQQLSEYCLRAVRDRAWAAEIGARARQRTLAEHTFDHRIAELERLWA